jgi:hypothetical protein
VYSSVDVSRRDSEWLFRLKDRETDMPGHFFCGLSAFRSDVPDWETESRITAATERGEKRLKINRTSEDITIVGL